MQAQMEKFQNRSEVPCVDADLLQNSRPSRKRNAGNQSYRIEEFRKWKILPIPECSGLLLEIAYLHRGSLKMNSRPGLTDLILRRDPRLCHKKGYSDELS